MWFVMSKVLACIYNQLFIKLDVVTDKHLKKPTTHTPHTHPKNPKTKLTKKYPPKTDKGSFSKNHEAGTVIMTF